jgi:hypothetical protein
MFINEKLCAKCRGKCCKAAPGVCYPEDFGLPEDFSKLDAALKSGKYAIDWWFGDARYCNDETNEDHIDKLNRTYFVRPATKNKIGILYDRSWGGECVFLNDNGCALSEDERPLNCKKLEPKKDGKCFLHDNVGRQNAAIAWIAYQDRLNNVTKE